MDTQRLSISLLFKYFFSKIATTWLLVIMETTLLALIPLMLGYAIDDLLAASPQSLIYLAGIFAGLILISVLRRIYDTRVYSFIRLKLGMALDKRQQSMDVSKRSARLDMSQELVDFLEEEVPQLLTAFIQILVTVVVLMSFDMQLALSAGFMVLAMVSIYALFHRRFFRLNAAYNGLKEQQVSILGLLRQSRLHQYLKQLRNTEVSLSDTEAVLYGLIFVLICGFVINNLWLSIHLPDISAGRIFSIVSYSWEFAEAAIMLPITLQSWSRLSEITKRINQLNDGEISLLNQGS